MKGADLFVKNLPFFISYRVVCKINFSACIFFENLNLLLTNIFLYFFPATSFKAGTKEENPPLIPDPASLFEPTWKHLQNQGPTFWIITLFWFYPFYFSTYNLPIFTGLHLFVFCFGFWKKIVANILAYLVQEVTPTNMIVISWPLLLYPNCGGMINVANNFSPYKRVGSWMFPFSCDLSESFTVILDGAGTIIPSSHSSNIHKSTTIRVNVCLKNNSHSSWFGKLDVFCIIPSLLLVMSCFLFCFNCTCFRVNSYLWNGNNLIDMTNER